MPAPQEGGPSEAGDSTLSEAARLERDFRWKDAAGLYSELIARESGSAAERRAELQQRHTYSLFRAAFQAENADEYRSLMGNAGDAAKQASALYDVAGLQAKAVYYSAWAEWLNYFLAMKREQTLPAVERGLELLDEASALFTKDGDLQGEGQALVLWLEMATWRSELWLPARLSIELRGPGEEHAQRALAIADRLRNQQLRARVLIWLSVLYETIAHSRKMDVIERLGQIADEAVRLLRGIEDPWDAFWGNCMLMWSLSSAGRDSEIERRLAMEALPIALQLRDHRLIGYGHLLMMSQISLVTEDPDEAERAFRQLLHHAAELEQHLLRIPTPDTLSLGRMFSLSFVTRAHVAMAQLTTDSQKRKSLLEAGIQKGLSGMHLSDSALYRSFLSGALASAYGALATEEVAKMSRAELLRHAATYAEMFEQGMREASPLFHGPMGSAQGQIGQVLYELAALQDEPTAKRKLLEQASQRLYQGISTMLGEPFPSDATYRRLGILAETSAKALQALRTLGKDLQEGKSSLDMWQQAADFYARAGQLSRVAEIHWQMALEHDAEGLFGQSLKSYSAAAEAFQNATKKIPALSAHLTDYATYMEGWKAVAEARDAHEDEKYGEAELHYLDAAEIFGKTRKWSHLKDHYVACSLLERGENFSRQEQAESALNSFREGEGAFDRAASQLKTHRRKVTAEESSRELNSWAQISEARKRYCAARSDVQEAKLLDQQGRRLASARKFLEAAKVFERLATEAESEASRADFQLNTLLCRGWAEMKQAEAEASSDRFANAARMFLQAKESTSKEKAGLLALGNAALCQALELGTRFKASRNDELFASAKRYMESAASYYLEAGYERAANSVRATERLFDAFVLFARAEAEVDMDRRTQLYASAEKHLQTARSLFAVAGYAGRQDEVDRYLRRAREERELLLPLSSPGGPALTTAASHISPPTLIRDKALGLEGFERASVVANILVSKSEVKVGDELQCELEIVNAGRGPALLVKVEGLVPEGCEITAKPDQYRLERNALELKGRRLDPFHTEEIRFALKMRKKGKPILRPRILYVNEAGQYQAHEPNPIEIQVQEIGIRGWLRGPER